MTNNNLGIMIAGFAIDYGLVGDRLLSKLVFGEWFHVTKAVVHSIVVWWSELDDNSHDDWGGFSG